MEHFDEGTIADAKFIVHKIELNPFDSNAVPNKTVLLLSIDCLYMEEGDILAMPPEYKHMIVLLGPTEGADEDGYWRYRAVTTNDIDEKSILPGDLLVKIGSTKALPSQADNKGAILGWFSCFDGIIATDSPNQPTE